MNWYLKVLKQYADFSGRARRTEYWMFELFNVLIQVIAYVLALVAAVSGLAGLTVAIYVLVAIYALAVLIPSLAVVVRRLHDTGKGGGWIFISLVPIIGSIWLLILLVSDSEVDNRFGVNPKK
jgi:uncharacterized membrane protein YhaH (DUF805 family)